MYKHTCKWVKDQVGVDPQIGYQVIKLRYLDVYVQYKLSYKSKEKDHIYYVGSVRIGTKDLLVIWANVCLSVKERRAVE